MGNSVRIGKGSSCVGVLLAGFCPSCLSLILFSFLDIQRDGLRFFVLAFVHFLVCMYVRSFVCMGLFSDGGGGNWLQMLEF